MLHQACLCRASKTSQMKHGLVHSSLPPHFYSSPMCLSLMSKADCFDYLDHGWQAKRTSDYASHLLSLGLARRRDAWPSCVIAIMCDCPSLFISIFRRGILSLHSLSPYLCTELHRCRGRALFSTRLRQTLHWIRTMQ